MRSRPPRGRAHDPGGVRVPPGGVGRRRDRGSRTRRGREAARRWAFADPGAEAPHRATVGARRRRPARRSPLRARRRRPDRDRRADPARAARRRPRPRARLRRRGANGRRSSAIRRSATGARSAGPSPTPTPPRTSPRCCSLSTPTSSRAARTASGRSPRRRSSSGPFDDCARAAGGAHRDPRPEGRARRLPQAHTPRTGLGDRRCGGGGRGRHHPGGVREHGPDAAARPRGRGRARERRRSRRGGRTLRRGHRAAERRQPAAGSTARTWRRSTSGGRSSSSSRACSICCSKLQGRSPANSSVCSPK